MTAYSYVQVNTVPGELHLECEPSDVAVGN